GHVERFLRHKDKVKITIMFRGREVTHPERGVMILDRLAEELAELATVEQRPLQDGRNMTMMLGPSKAVLSGEIDAHAEAAAGADDAPAPAAASSGALGGDGGDALAPRPPRPPADSSDADAAVAVAPAPAAEPVAAPAATSNGDAPKPAAAKPTDAQAPAG
ncbi:MAG: translation initiation factor, partial [Solirubrobacteraceae bacterium]|nr:translation initiation factor [Solirubrobacteraceae bacterium]